MIIENFKNENEKNGFSNLENLKDNYYQKFPDSAH